ncbi:MAG: FtsX-like permease family protein [Methylocystaceae bacterium]|nr:FtsX-like permease family protein [Methylocystaceae bacterium]
MKIWIERQRSLIDFTVAGLLRRKVRNLGLMAVYSCVVFILATVMLFTHSLRKEASVLLSDAPEITVQRVIMGRHALIEHTDLDVVSKIRGARHARGRLWGYFYDTANGANYTLMVPDKVHTIKQGQVQIGAGVARARDLKKGKFLFLTTNRGKLFKLQVSGILSTESELVSSDLVLMSEQDYRNFFRLPSNVYTDLVLNVRNSREVTKIAEKISAVLPDSRVITRDDILRTYESLFSWREGILLALLGGALCSFIIFAWDKTSGLSASERQEIGILKAVGWETSDILTMKLWESVLISLGAFLFAYTLAYLHVFYFSAGLLEPVLKGWAILYPQFHLTPEVDPLQVMTLLFFTVFPYVAATLVPIWRAAIIDPDTVMR